MTKEEIVKIFNDFIVNYSEEERMLIWEGHIKFFKDFWSNKILNDKQNDISESEIDEVIKILDKNGKGNTPESESIAKVMITQGTWRRMFRDIKAEPKLHVLLDKIFKEDNVDEKAKLIDALYKANEGRKNGLTGTSGNAISAMISLYNPYGYISMVSLRDRRRLMEYFNIPDGPDFDNDSQGRRIAFSNKAIIDFFRSVGIKANPRTISYFLYMSDIKGYWKVERDEDYAWGGSRKHLIETAVESRESSDISLFYMESQLEDFLIENWDKTELGKEYELIEEDGEMVSQQYFTDIGRIDILVRDKKTKQYVVIELKKNQTSDDTVGQLTRYMGWLEEHKTKGKDTKGIIIAAKFDNRLHYALKKVKDVEVYLYRVNFKLAEFKR